MTVPFDPRLISSKDAQGNFGGKSKNEILNRAAIKGGWTNHYMAAAPPFVIDFSR
jgi:hypothetical protein